MALRIRSDRLGKIWSAYALAAIAAGSAISSVMAVTVAFGPNGFPNSDLAGKVGGAAFVAVMIAVFAIPFTFLLALLPAAAAILYAEARRIRSPTGYAAMGVLVSAVAFGGGAAFLAWHERPRQPVRAREHADRHQRGNGGGARTVRRTDLLGQSRSPCR